MMRFTAPAAAILAAFFATGAIAGEVAPTAVVFDDEGSVATPLTATPGDPKNGREVFAARKLGNCLACHVNADRNDLPWHGEVGPSLDGVADRWTENELRGIIVNSKKMFEGTIMPSFYRLENGARPRDKFVGKTILTAQEVEDVVAYLTTLKEE